MLPEHSLALVVGKRVVVEGETLVAEAAVVGDRAAATEEWAEEFVAVQPVPMRITFH